MTRQQSNKVKWQKAWSALMGSLIAWMMCACTSEPVSLLPPARTSPTAVNPPPSTLNTSLPTSAASLVSATPSPIIVAPTLTQPALAIPTAIRPTTRPSSVQPANLLIPASAPRVYQATVSIPTYGYERALQSSGKDDPIYPYPHLDFDQIGPLVSKNYRAVVLENSYTEVTILPELGGRIWRIVDKTTGRTVTYQNPVVKPTPWGYRGWWLATGGMEWCLPVEEHGLDEYRPWNVIISGLSVTVSDHEDRTGLDVAVTISLDEAHNYVTIQPRVTNSTGSPQKMQFWINAMLALSDNRVSDSTRFILTARQVTVHSTNDEGVPNPGGKMDWPVYRGRDFSQYANWHGYLGFFASPAAQADFVGAYDTSSDQGIVRVFPSGVARGAKFFGVKGIDPATWTNDGSTYFELWGGLLPTFWDYTTLQPGQTFGWTERWYPVSGLRSGFDAANATAALRLSSQGSNISVGAVTSLNVSGQVRLWHNGRIVATWPVAIGPGRAFNGEWSVISQGTVPGRPLVIGVQLLDSAGNVLARAGSVP